MPFKTECPIWFLEFCDTRGIQKCTQILAKQMCVLYAILWGNKLYLCRPAGVVTLSEIFIIRPDEQRSDNIGRPKVTFMQI